MVRWCVGLVLVGVMTVLAVAAPSQPALHFDRIEVEAGKLVRVTLEGAPPDCDINWLIIPEPDGLERAITVPTRLEFIAPPGDYQIICCVLVRDGEKVWQRILTGKVRVRPAVQPPQPSPPPRPEPPGGPAPPTPPSPTWVRNTMAAMGVTQTGSGRCTATHVKISATQSRSVFLTAAHCVGAVGSKVVFTTRRLPTELTVHCVVVAVNRDADCAWLMAEDNRLYWEIPYAELSGELPPNGTAVWHAGFGVNIPGNTEEGTVVAVETEQLQFDLSASPGDSGAAIVWRVRDQIVSVVCCGTTPGRRGPVWGARTDRIHDTWEKSRSGPTAPSCPSCPRRDVFPRFSPALAPAAPWTP